MHNKEFNITTGFKVDPDCRNLISATLDELLPGVKAHLSCITRLPYSGKLGLYWQNDYAAMSSILYTTKIPKVEFSGVVGRRSFSVGTNVSYDLKTQKFSKCEAGLNVSCRNLYASLIWKDNANTLNASFCQSPSSHTVVGVELVHNFSAHKSTVTVGTQHEFDPLTMVKARVNNNGEVSALIRHEWRPRTFFTVSGEVDLTAMNKGPKLGLLLAMSLDQDGIDSYPAPTISLASSVGLALVSPYLM